MNNEEKILQTLDLLVNEMGSLKDGQGKIITRLDSMDARFDGIDTRLDSMENRLEGLEAGQNILAGQVVSLTGDVQEIRQSQVRMENELTDKVRALFDAREVSFDYFASIKSELVILAEGQETIKRTFYRLESKQEEQERELRLLRIERR